MGNITAGWLDFKIAAHCGIDLPPGLLAGAFVVLAIPCWAEQLAFHAPAYRALAGLGGLGQAVYKGQAVFWRLTRKEMS